MKSLSLKKHPFAYPVVERICEEVEFNILMFISISLVKGSNAAARFGKNPVCGIIT